MWLNDVLKFCATKIVIFLEKIAASFVNFNIVMQTCALLTGRFANSTLQRAVN